MKQHGPRPFLRAEWRNLLMINYTVDLGVLLPHLPTGTQIDLWQGRAYVSLVGFRFLNTRVLGVPIPFHRNFDEVNLRFYIRRRIGNEWRKGVVFVKEIVPRWAIAFVARTIYNENYVCHAMRNSVNIPGEVKYEWRHNGSWEHIAATTVGEPIAPSVDSKETFITEHYWGYAKQRDGSTMEYAVEHPAWRVWRCESPKFMADAGRLYGEAFAPYLNASPASAFLAEGSPVVVRRGVRL